MHNTEDNALDTEGGKKRDEDDEIFVVTFANAGSEPWTMMIQSFDAAMAYSTVYSSWWSVNITGVAVLDFGKLSIYNVKILIPLLF